MRRLVGAYRSIEAQVNCAACVLAIYLAGANVLRAAKWPDEATWQPWTAWFILLLVAALGVPLFALLKYFDAKQEKRDKQEAQETVAQRELDADMARLCQEIAAALAHACQGLSLDKVAVQVWLCDEQSGGFDRRWRFFLPFDRVASGIVWKKGLGIAGAAWAQGRDLAVSIKPGKKLSRAEFEQLAPNDRYGMAYDQIQSSAYTGIIAVRLYAHETGDTLLGMLVIDYTGDGDFEQAMIDQAQADTKQPLPYGAKEIHLGPPGYSATLAARLAESGASDAAIDAAGGPGTADRLHEADGSSTRNPSGDPVAALGA